MSTALLPSKVNRCANLDRPATLKVASSRPTCSVNLVPCSATVCGFHSHRCIAIGREIFDDCVDIAISIYMRSQMTMTFWHNASQRTWQTCGWGTAGAKRRGLVGTSINNRCNINLVSWSVFDIQNWFSITFESFCGSHTATSDDKCHSVALVPASAVDNFLRDCR